MSIECSNCRVDNQEACGQLYKQSASRIIAWADTLAEFTPYTTPERCLNSAADIRTFEISRLRLPLQETAHCSEWDNETFVSDKLTESIGKELGE